jgi:hypothetical protein
MVLRNIGQLYTKLIESLAEVKSHIDESVRDLNVDKSLPESDAPLDLKDRYTSYYNKLKELILSFEEKLSNSGLQNLTDMYSELPNDTLSELPNDTLSTSNTLPTLPTLKKLKSTDDLKSANPGGGAIMVSARKPKKSYRKSHKGGKPRKSRKH